MKKFSRRYGWMWLRTYASGDGSICFLWTDSDRHGIAVAEPVTESDVSEYLRLPEMAKRWKGWDILDLGTRDVRIARDVERPFHTSCRLGMGGQDYRYSEKDGTYEFYTGVHDDHVENIDVISSLTYFLKNEFAFDIRAKQRKG